jgi:hypothetical protein
MFSGLRNSIALLRRLDVEAGSEKFKMVLPYRIVLVSQLIYIQDDQKTSMTEHIFDDGVLRHILRLCRTVCYIT